ncbi:MAG: four helix bundle protein [Candidatus Gottesmanbacteria bacterium]
METLRNKITSFTDLIVWQEGHKLVLLIYQITRSFPQEEIYCLTNQMRRCAISITSNIAEGFSRQGLKEKIQFYYMALGSITELQNQLLLARDLRYIGNNQFQNLAGQTVVIHKLLNGLIKSLKR